MTILYTYPHKNNNNLGSQQQNPPKHDKTTNKIVSTSYYGFSTEITAAMLSWARFWVWFGV